MKLGYGDDSKVLVVAAQTRQSVAWLRDKEDNLNEKKKTTW